MSRELFIDIMPLADGPRDTYKVVLAGYRNGGAPKIERISVEDLVRRLQSVLLWPEETTDRLQHDLSRLGKLANERLESPTDQHLGELGFVGL